MSIYDFSAETLDGKPAPLSDWRDQVMLIVNTASKCGFTGQYAGLEALYRKYRDRGFVVLGFPSNQFGQQEPGDAMDLAGRPEIQGEGPGRRWHRGGVPRLGARGGRGAE